MIEVKVKGVSVDQGGNFLILLVDDEETKVLPVTVGKLEAQNILVPIEGVEVPRPLSHDLLKSTIEALGAEVKQVIITKIENNTYFAEIHMKQGEKDVVLDSRPSDAIALALRCDIPIFIKFPLIEFTYDLSDIKLI
ncbi:MAG TPA: bifunctional nuclease family protein [Tepidimicrobium sp.]|nr:bifunctional nuclease family protein [Tepidimicrobium sp.]